MLRRTWPVCVPLTVKGPRSLGRGVALVVDAPPLMILRRALADRWRDVLTPQDRQGFRPHVTVQNKVQPIEAERLLADLQGSFQPMTAAGIGLLLWRYLGGPWERRALFRFTGDEPSRGPSSAIDRWR